MPPLPERFMSKVTKSSSGCWHWTARVDKNGYGQYAKSHSEPVPAHRFAYEHVHGALPRRGEPGHLHVDHECHNRSKSCEGGPTCLHRRCVNPAHLVAKPAKGNILASRHTKAAQNVAKTHCPRGHELAGDNVYLDKRTRGGRTCRRCAIDRSIVNERKRLAEERGPDWKRTGWQAAKTHCKHGHPLSGENLYLDVRNGKRACRTCRADTARRHAERRRAARG